MTFAEDIQAAIALLGAGKDDPVVDFVLDPGRARRALDAVEDGAGIVVRGLPEHAAAASPGYGPVPVDPLWIRIMRGAREIGTAQLRGGDGMVRRAVHVELDEREETCCDAPGCDRRRAHATVWIVLEGAAKGAAPERVLVAEERAAGAPDVARGIAASLGEAMGVEVRRDGAPVTLEPGDAPAPLGEAFDAPVLARFSMRTEGDRVVLRDWDNIGPRATAPRNAWIGGVILVVALGCFAVLARSIATGAQGSAIGAGIAGALLALTGYTFVSVARFSAKYGARSTPLLWIGRDRLTVMPWVGRDGAVDARPEGRFGAAMPLVDFGSAMVVERDGEVVLRLETDHGPFDVSVCPGRPVAELLTAAIERTVEETRHPRANQSARKRARARAAAAAV